MIAAVSLATLQALRLPHLQGPPAPDWFDLSRGGWTVDALSGDAESYVRQVRAHHEVQRLLAHGWRVSVRYEGGRCVSVSW